MEKSENPILGTDQTSQAFKVGLYKSSRRRTRCTNTGIPALSSTFAIACAMRAGIQAILLAILVRPFVGDLRRLRKFY
jgi:hypothetical protein